MSGNQNCLSIISDGCGVSMDNFVIKNNDGLIPEHWFGEEIEHHSGWFKPSEAFWDFRCAKMCSQELKYDNKIDFGYITDNGEIVIFNQNEINKHCEFLEKFDLDYDDLNESLYASSWKYTWFILFCGIFIIFLFIFVSSKSMQNSETKNHVIVL